MSPALPSALPCGQIKLFEILHNLSVEMSLSIRPRGPSEGEVTSMKVPSERRVITVITLRSDATQLMITFRLMQQRHDVSIRQYEAYENLKRIR